MIDKTWHIRQVMQGIHVWFGKGLRGGRWLGRACRTKQRYAVADFNHARLQETAAIADIVIEPAKQTGVDLRAWLADTLALIPDQKINRIDELLPWTAR
jgi:hypothetical protein